jgi:AcrR family transcriptional regulator
VKHLSHQFDYIQLPSCCKYGRVKVKQTGGFCVMEELKYKDTVKEAIVIALIELMKERDINSISIKDIVEKAGVGRSSFYRNFNNKEEILLLYRRTNLNVKRSVAFYNLYRNPYQAAFFSGAGISVLIQWIERGFKESEEELTDMFIYLMDGHHREKI